MFISMSLNVDIFLSILATKCCGMEIIIIYLNCYSEYLILSPSANIIKFSFTWKNLVALIARLAHKPFFAYI